MSKYQTTFAEWVLIKVFTLMLGTMCDEITQYGLHWEPTERGGFSGTLAPAHKHKLQNSYCEPRTIHANVKLKVTDCIRGRIDRIISPHANNIRVTSLHYAFCRIKCYHFICLLPKTVPMFDTYECMIQCREPASFVLTVSDFSNQPRNYVK